MKFTIAKSPKDSQLQICHLGHQSPCQGPAVGLKICMLAWQLMCAHFYSIS